MEKVSKNEISEGEEFIIDFLKLYDIKYKREVQINGLKDDKLKYRVADFYLPQYKVYIEFFGQWNVSYDHKARYTDKKDVYSKNKIPCIYIYPENLGTMPFSFDKRIQKVMLEHDLTKELRKYHFKKFFNEMDRIIGIIIVLTFMLLYINSSQTNKPIAVSFGLLIIGYQLVKLVMAYVKIFITNKYPLSNLNY
ncbi:MAG: hypothetical protein WAQ28_11910 [Bacteroidia bacterium]